MMPKFGFQMKSYHFGSKTGKKTSEKKVVRFPVQEDIIQPLDGTMKNDKNDFFLSFLQMALLLGISDD
jgi:hypothetical protein